MDLDLLKALNDFAAAHDAFEDPVTFYNKLSILLFAGLLTVLFLFGRRQGARAAVAAGAGRARDRRRRAPRGARVLARRGLLR